MYAKIAAKYIHAYCRETFQKEGINIASSVANGTMMDVFDHKGFGSHKYIPAERLTTDLNYPFGAGVYGYWKMADGSYLLRTCDGPLAVWAGDETKAERVE